MEASFLQAPFECFPDTIDLGEVRIGETLTRVVSLSGAGTKPLWIEKWESSHPAIRVLEIVDGRVAEVERKAVLEIRVEKEGDIEGHVMFVPDDSALDPSGVTVRYRVAQKPVVVTPSSLFLSGTKDAKGLIRVPRGCTVKSDLSAVRVAKKSEEEDATAYEYDASGAELGALPHGKIGTLRILDAEGRSVGSIPVFR